jgi:hypothetical protein
MYIQAHIHRRKAKRAENTYMHSYVWDPWVTSLAM